MSVLIETKGLGRNFGNIQAVKQISFSVSAGDVLGFLGPNGAGKSTTMKMLSCFLEPSAGTATVAGFDIREDSQQVRRHIGYLPESAPLYSEMNVYDFLSFIADVRGLSGASKTSAINVVVERTSLGSVLRQRIATLSKGFRRRVGLAQALIHDPEILILDEPTDGLDPNQKHEVRELINQMTDKCIIFSTHILEEVDAVCNRVIIIANGEIVADDTPKGLRARTGQTGTYIRLRVAASNVNRVEEFLAAQEYLGKVSRIEQGSDALFTVETFEAKGYEPQKVFREAIEGSWGLKELAPYVESLDEVFREITSSQEMS